MTVTYPSWLAILIAPALISACGFSGAERITDDALASASSEVQVVQSCPGYNSCEENPIWEPIGAAFCGNVDGMCGYECVPAPGRPAYCDSQIEPTPECCSDLVPRLGELQLMQNYYWCHDYAGNACRVVLQDTWIVGCGC